MLKMFLMGFVGFVGLISWVLELLLVTVPVLMADAQERC
jgi:hypothetical protein